MAGRRRRFRNFDGLTAVVTGGGSGIGLAIAEALARRGCRLALADLRSDRLSEARRHLEPLTPMVTTYVVDVAEDAAVAAFSEEVAADHDRVAILVNSAGVSVAGPFAETPPEDFDWVMRVNFGGTVKCCRAFLPILLGAERAQIVNIGSCFGWVGFPGKSGYCASKFAVRGFSEALRTELRESPVGVTVVYPGPVDTNIARDGRATDAAQREDEIVFLAKRAIPADRVAARVFRGIERDADRVIVGRDYRLIDFAVRLAPTWSLAALGRLAPK